MGSHKHGLLPFGRFDLLLQKDVDAEGGNVGVSGRLLRGQLQARAQQAARQVSQTFDLWQECGLTGLRPQPVAARAKGQQ